MNDVDPLNKAVPPDDAAYQSIVSPAPGEAEIVTVPVPHLEAALPDRVPAFAFTFAVTAVLVAEIQPVVVFLASV